MSLPRSEHYDVVIVGAGMVGASLALALAGKGGESLRVLLVEAGNLHASDPGQPGFDARSTVLSAGTVDYFAKLGIWAALSPHAEAISRIHVSDQGRFGTVQMNSADEGVEALGYVCENRDLGRVFNTGLQQAANLELCSPASVSALQPVPEGMQMQITAGDGNTSDVEATLVVLAEGGRSGLCRQLGIGHQEHDYRQAAVIANIALAQPHHQVAYERFTAKGPLALLPLADREGLHRAALIWTHPLDKAGEVAALDDAAFLQQLQDDFGNRKGRFVKVGKRVVFPLRLQTAQEQIRPGLVLLGNVAHSLHPVAGQGFNLALRDTMALAHNILASKQHGESPGAYSRLQAYIQTVEADQHRTISFSDYMTRMFSSSSGALAVARRLGMASIDLLPPLRHALSRQAMGLAGPQVSLARQH